MLLSGSGVHGTGLASQVTQALLGQAAGVLLSVFRQVEGNGPGEAVWEGGMSQKASSMPPSCGCEWTSFPSSGTQFPYRK